MQKRQAPSECFQTLPGCWQDSYQRIVPKDCLRCAWKVQNALQSMPSISKLLVWRLKEYEFKNHYIFHSSPFLLPSPLLPPPVFPSLPIPFCPFSPVLLAASCFTFQRHKASWKSVPGPAHITPSIRPCPCRHKAPKEVCRACKAECQAERSPLQTRRALSPCSCWCGLPGWPLCKPFQNQPWPTSLPNIQTLKLLCPMPSQSKAPAG